LAATLIKVKAAEGRRVRDHRPPYAVIPAAGIEVDPGDLYWVRRLRDGDVVSVSAADAPANSNARKRSDA
jgi:hypothetical protein